MANRRRGLLLEAFELGVDGHEDADGDSDVASVDEAGEDDVNDGEDTDASAADEELDIEESESVFLPEGG